MGARRLTTWTRRIALGLFGLILLAALGVWLLLRASLAQVEGRH
ncbi:MAG: hypothetical protein JWR65_4678, partial [Massilia sp.]|nr:hypothetical protein [Massilia sp.]